MTLSTHWLRKAQRTQFNAKLGVEHILVATYTWQTYSGDQMKTTTPGVRLCEIKQPIVSLGSHSLPALPVGHTMCSLCSLLYKKHKLRT